MKKNGLNGYANEFSVDYKTNDIRDIVDINKYVMKKHNIFRFNNDLIIMFRFTKKCLLHY